MVILTCNEGEVWNPASYLYKEKKQVAYILSCLIAFTLYVNLHCQGQIRKRSFIFSYTSVNFHAPMHSLVMFFFTCFWFYFIFKLYIIVLVLPNIKMNPPQVYMCSPPWALLPPPSPYDPSGSSQCARTHRTLLIYRSAHSVAIAKCLVTQSCLTFAILWILARQSPLSMRFSRQE